MLCRIAKVSRAGYYKRQRRKGFFTSREVQEQQLIGLIKDIHNNRKSLGYASEAIAIEDLNMRGMAQGLKLAKSTNDNGFGMLKTFLAIQ